MTLITRKNPMWLDELKKKMKSCQIKDLPSKIFEVPKALTETVYLRKIIEFSVATNFGIAAISTHIEKSTRRVRYWSIWIMFDQLKKWININVAEYMSHFQSTIPTTWSKNWTKWDRVSQQNTISCWTSSLRLIFIFYYMQPKHFQPWKKVKDTAKFFTVLWKLL